MRPKTLHKTRSDSTSGGGIVSRQVMITTLSPAYGNLAFIKTLDNISGGIPPTADWAFGAFSPRFGYPSLGIFHQERLVLANTKEDPETMWFSQSASWEDFGTSIPAEDTDAITVTLAAKQLNEIRGMASRSDLLIFTSGGEWTAKSGSKSDVFTPSSIVVTPSGYRGSANIEPVDVGNVTLFAQRHGKVVRGMGYQLDIDGYSSSELSVLSPHLFEDSRVTRWAYQQDPWSIVWIVLDSGVVLTLTLQQEHQVTAWARQVFNGPVRDICCIPGDGQDEVFMLIGNNLAMLRHRNDKNFTPGMYLDGGTDPYTTSFESMELEHGTGNGSLQGRHKHVAGATLRLYRTCGLKTGIMTENSSKIDPAVFPGDLSPRNRPDPYTGEVYVKMPGGVSRTCRVRVENSAPQPVTLLGIFQEVEINEG
jgi:hypothetical protein